MTIKNLLKTLLFLTTLFGLSAYGAQDTSSKLLGKTFKYTYKDAVYHVQFKSASELHWKAMQGEEAGREDLETYTLQKISPTEYFIAWIEKDGLGVSQVLNLKEKRVHTFLKIDKELISLNGTLTQLN